MEYTWLVKISRNMSIWMMTYIMVIMVHVIFLKRIFEICHFYLHFECWHTSCILYKHLQMDVQCFSVPSKSKRRCIFMVI